MKPELHNKPLIPYGWLRAVIFFMLYIALVVAASVLLFLFQKKSSAGSDQTIPSEGVFYLAVVINAFIAVILVWLFRKIIDRRSFESIGFKTGKNGAHAGAGFFLGIFILCAGSCILYFTKNLQWTDISFNGNDLFIGFGFMVIVAFYEEIVFRGYILNNLMDSLSKWPALGISALLFSLAHLSNPSFSVAGAFNILLAGILLGLNYVYTKNLWFGIMLHFTWNFFQGPVLGYEVSGMPLKSLLQQKIQGNELITGGKFGFEGSLLATAFYILAIVAFIWVYEKKYQPFNQTENTPVAN